MNQNTIIFYILSEKNRPSPCVLLPDLVIVVASPPVRITPCDESDLFMIAQLSVSHWMCDHHLAKVVIELSV
jgi:hypothetical protein